LEYRKVTQYTAFSILHETESDFSFNYRLQLHYTAENYTWFDVSLQTVLFYDYSKEISPYFQINFGYFKSVDDEVRYFDGPAFGIELGSYFYPKDDGSYVKFDGKANLFYFKDESILHHNPGDLSSIALETVDVSNKYTLLSAGAEIRWRIDNLAFPFSIYYSHFFWLDEDRTEHLYKSEDRYDLYMKRRVDHLLNIDFSAEFYFSENLFSKIFYSLGRTFSNIGTESTDYTDYNFTHHTVGSEITYVF